MEKDFHIFLNIPPIFQMLQDDQSFLNNSHLHHKGLLFKDKENNPLKGKNVSTKWHKILKECNIPHSIRDTYGSMLLQKWVDIETVTELMGHTAISITQIYMHSGTKLKSKSVNKLNSILN